MSENETKTGQSQPVMQNPESQHQRWVKYGVNVAVMTIIAIVLVGLLTYLAQAHAKRIDTTTGGAQSLSPQTMNIIKDQKQKIHIVALYPRLRTEAGEQDYYQPVADLLADYGSKGSNITTEMIDPNVDKTGVDKLVSDVTNKYGGDVKDYKAIIADLPGVSDAAKKYGKDEFAKFQELPFDQVTDQNTQQLFWIGASAIASISKQMDNLKDSVDSDVDQKVPSYKDAIDEIKRVFSNMSDALGAVSNSVMTPAMQNDKLPKEFKAYLPDAVKRTDAAKKIVDDYLARIQKLPPVKQLDEFKQQLTSKSIIVEADDGYKIIPATQIWPPAERSNYAAPGEETHKYRFAGEQQVSMAISSLESPNKQMVVFVYSPANPNFRDLIGAQGRGGMLRGFANRLREYNFDVQAKEVGGPPQDPEQPPQDPGPTPEQMKTAIWVVVRYPEDNAMAAQMGMPGPSQINQMLADHLKEGGSAMVATMPLGDAMTEVFSPLGVTIKPDYMLVKDILPPSDHHVSDQAEIFDRQYQFVFLMNQYGDHPLTRPLADLDMLTLFMAPVVAADTVPGGVTVTPLLPMPNVPHSWAAKDGLQKLQQGEDKFSYTAGDDIDNTAAKPLYGAAAIEKSGSGRVVVVGGWQFLDSSLLTLPDPKDPDVPRLPGNSEFAMDSIFWLAHMDSMLAISPHALQMARIKPMSAGTVNFIRVGLLTAGLPLIVALAGLLVYVRRRD